MGSSLDRTAGSLITRRTMTVALGAMVAGMTDYGAAIAQQSSCGPPAVIGDGWPIAIPGDIGIDGARLCDMTHWLDGLHAGNIHSVLVVRHGALTFEYYRKGSDEIWNQPIA